MTPATTNASVTGVSSTANGRLPGRRTASRSFSSHSTVCPGFSGIRAMSGYIASGAIPAALSEASHASMIVRDTTATGVLPAAVRRPTAKYNWSMSSVSCSSSANGTARASLAPLPGGRSASAKRTCVAGASTTILAVAPTAAASAIGPDCRGPAGAPASSTVSHSVSVWPGAGSRSNRVNGMVYSKCSKIAQQGRDFAPVAAQQKTVQGEFRSSKRDMRG